MENFKTIPALALFCLCLSLHAVLADNYYVSSFGSDLTGDGSQGNPWLTLTHALSSINGTPSNPHTIFVEVGFYSPAYTGEPFPIHLKSYVSLQGAGANQTILTPVDDVVTIVSRIFNSDSISNVNIDGFTIQNGTALSDSGGAVQISNCQNISITNCSVRSDTATFGGGISISNSSNIAIANDSISNNYASNHVDWTSYGGAIYINQSSEIIISNNSIDNNVSNAQVAMGGGIYINHSSFITVKDNRIDSNYAYNNFGGGGQGGGIAAEESEFILITQNVIVDNHAWGDAGLVGGVDLRSNKSMICYNTISENGSSNYFSSIAGGLFCSKSSVILGNLIDNNFTFGFGGGVAINGKVLIIRNTITNNKAYAAYDIVYTTGGGGIGCGNSGIIGSSKNNGNNIYGNIGQFRVDPNTVINRGNQLAQQNSTTSTISAKYNYFGSGIIPHTEEEVYGNFDIDPYLSTPIDFDSTNLVVVPSPIQFDTVLTNQSDSIEVVFFNVTNSLHDSIEVYSLIHNNPVFDFSESSFTLSPIGRYEIISTMNSAIAGEYRDTLNILTNIGNFQIEIMGICVDTVTAIENRSNTLPRKFSLKQNYPNPFNPATTIEYSIPLKGIVKIVVYDIVGAKVRTLVNKEQIAGDYKTVWDGKNDLGKHVSSGVYLYKIQTQRFSSTKRMVLLR